MLGNLPSLRALNYGQLVPRDAAPCPDGDRGPPEEVREVCRRNVTQANGRHYEVMRHATYQVPLLRVTFDQPSGIDGELVTRLEFFKFTRESARKTRRRASNGTLPHGRGIEPRPHYFVLGMDQNGMDERTHNTMLSIVPIAPTGSDMSPGHETTVIGNTPFADLERTALAIIAENPQSFFDLTPYS